MSALEPNRIHTLPVQVSYHLPSSSQIFTTLLPTLQQVYVYPAAPSTSTSSSASASGSKDEEAWGSIYLKTVVQGVILSSPEYLPSPSNSATDLSLYTFDPRETYLRRSRVGIHPPHLRRSAASSPLLASPDISNHSGQGQGGEVWTGKGLVSKALDEPGLGKNLITGRLVRRREFAMSDEGVDPLMALMQAKEEGGWGIEVSLGLRNGQGGQTFGLGPQSIVGSRSTSPMPTPIASSSSAPPPMPARHSYPAVPQARRPPIPSARTTSYLPPSSEARSSTPARPLPATTRKSTITKKRPTPPPRHLAAFDTNSRRPSKSTPGAGLPLDIPRHVYDNPDLLTKEQAERLIASPFFLDKLSEMTGHPLVPKIKREREDDVQHGGKKAKGKQEKEPTCCYNCGRINNLVWRHMVLDDGSTTVSICNACGLYRNRHGVMRPPAMWDGVDDEIKPARLVAMPSSDIDLPAQRLDTGFKRTMSTVVEQDAKRIARRKPVASRTMPMTSPPRGSKSVTKTARHSSSRIQQQPAASSPGPFTNRSRTPAPQHQLQQAFVFNPDDSPNTTLNKIIGASMPMQSLDMPLSDDGREKAQMPWTNTTNNNERFEMSAGPHGATSLKSPSPPPKFTRTSSTASKRFQHHHHQPSGGTDEDDVLSQLFNRTSSIGPLGSSPAPFDFSQLPPSSPPASNGPSSDIDLELGHSAMLLSSPDISPASSHSHHTKKVSPEKKSNLNQSFTPDDLNLNLNLNDTKGGQGPPSYDYDIEELWSKLQSQYDQQHPQGVESSGQIAEGLLGQSQVQGGEDDFLALFNSLTNDHAH